MENVNRKKSSTNSHAEKGVEDGIIHLRNSLVKPSKAKCACGCCGGHHGGSTPLEPSHSFPWLQGSQLTSSQGSALAEGSLLAQDESTAQGQPIANTGVWGQATLPSVGQLEGSPQGSLSRDKLSAATTLQFNFSVYPILPPSNSLQLLFQRPLPTDVL